MDNLGDWLYIVFLVVAVISGLFGSGKKKKAPMTDPDEQSDRPGSPSDPDKQKGFWELLEEVQNRPEETPKQQMPQKAVAKKTVSAKKQAASPAPFLTAEKNIADLIAKQSSPVMLEDTSADPYSVSREDFHLQDIEEVRKAIVYSEILNRKY